VLLLKGGGAGRAIFDSQKFTSSSTIGGLENTHVPLRGHCLRRVFNITLCSLSSCKTEDDMRIQRSVMLKIYSVVDECFPPAIHLFYLPI
jgi:hypothetical protein